MPALYGNVPTLRAFSVQLSTYHCMPMAYPATKWFVRVKMLLFAVSPPLLYSVAHPGKHLRSKCRHQHNSRFTWLKTGSIPVHPHFQFNFHNLLLCVVRCRSHPRHNTVDVVQQGCLQITLHWVSYVPLLSPVWNVR